MRKKNFVWIILILLLVYLLCNAISIWNYAKTDETREADIAIVLGAAVSGNEVTPVFRERINQGIWLYQNGYVKKLMITGGLGEGNLYSDAYMGSLYAREQGIPVEDILLEESSAITQENLENAKIIMDEQGFQSALIVSDPLHMKRAMLLAEDTGMEAYCSPTSTTMYQSLKTKLPFLAREFFFYVGYKWYRIF